MILFRGSLTYYIALIFSFDPVLEVRAEIRIFFSYLERQEKNFLRFPEHKAISCDGWS